MFHPDHLPSKISAPVLLACRIFLALALLAIVLSACTREDNNHNGMLGVSAFALTISPVTQWYKTSQSSHNHAGAVQGEASENGSPSLTHANSVSAGTTGVSGAGFATSWGLSGGLSGGVAF